MCVQLAVCSVFFILDIDFGMNRKINRSNLANLFSSLHLVVANVGDLLIFQTFMFLYKIFFVEGRP